MDPYAVKVSEIYTTSLLARARYEEEHGRPEVGRRYGLYALRFDPGFAEDDVPDFPLHIEDQIAEVLRNYADLRQRTRGLSEARELRERRGRQDSRAVKNTGKRASPSTRWERFSRPPGRD